jgi:hypothetical protein
MYFAHLFSIKLYKLQRYKTLANPASVCLLDVNKTPWSESASELYRPSDRRLSVKLVSNFEDRGVSHGQRNGSLLYSPVF